MTTMQTILAKHDAAKRSLSDFRERFAILTERQAELAVMLAKGYSCAEAAKAMGIAKTTATQSKVIVLSKLDVTSTAELAVMAYRAGLIWEAA